MPTEEVRLPPLKAADVRAALFWSLVLLLVSWLNVQVGITIGRHYIRHGRGYPGFAEIQDDLFRWDAVYYKSIADFGYTYNGDPFSGPNVVFSPMFPVLVRLVSSATGLDTLSCGFLLNKLLLLGGLTFLFLCLDGWIGRRRTVFVLAALATAAGSYAFHAYYSESTFFFFLGLSLLGYARGWWAVTALAAAGLGASRVTSLPLVAVFAAAFAWRAARAQGAARWRHLAYACVCLAGVGAYLAVLAVKFGNPFTLLNNVQHASWSRFHTETDWKKLLTGGYLIGYWGEAISRGPQTFFRIETTNLIWTTLALIAVVYLMLAWRLHIMTFLFLPYFFFVYATNTASPLLGSNHRIFMLMFPIFIMFTDLHGWLSRRVSPIVAWAVSGCLLLANAAYAVLHTAAFNQGVPYWC